MRFTDARESFVRWRCRQIKKDIPVSILITMVLVSALITWYTMAGLTRFAPELWSVTSDYWMQTGDLGRLQLLLAHLSLYGFVLVGCQFAFIGAAWGSELKDRLTPVLREKMAGYSDANLGLAFTVGLFGFVPTSVAQQYGLKHCDAINDGAGLGTWMLLGFDGLLACGGLVGLAISYVVSKEAAARFRSQREQFPVRFEKKLP